jgi:hypothetical protein
VERVIRTQRILDKEIDKIVIEDIYNFVKKIIVDF